MECLPHQKVGLTSNIASQSGTILTKGENSILTTLFLIAAKHAQTQINFDAYLTLMSMHNESTQVLKANLCMLGSCHPTVYQRTV